jgi:hypothetical protein
MDTMAKEDGDHMFLSTDIPKIVKALPQCDFMREVYAAVYQKAAIELIKKHRIYVEKSSNLMGVVDEYGVLEYGQCAVTMNRKNPLTNAWEPEYIEGPVVAVKNP